MLTADNPKHEKPKSASAVGTSRWRSPSQMRETHVLDLTMRVTTPENISFTYQLAGPFRRVFAYGFDILISIGGYVLFIILLNLLVVFVVMPLASMVGGAGLVEAVMGVLGMLTVVGYFVVYWFYGALFETYYNGQTLGKRITRLRVISTDGHAIDGVKATLRNFFRFLDIMPFVPIATLLQLEDNVYGYVPTCLFGLVMMTLTKNFQRAGDLVAGTVVIVEEKKQRPNLATFLDERVPQLAELIPTSYVPPASMARVIAEYVDQRKFLPFQRASEIASHLAIPLMEKLGLPADTDHDLFICAFYYKIFVSTGLSEADDFAPRSAISQPAEFGLEPIPHASLAVDSASPPGHATKSSESELPTMSTDLKARDATSINPPDDSPQKTQVDEQ